MLGWKEYEMEVVRDKADNCIIICSIENIDPMGVHTGDSITVAPALTLTDKEYQIMRDASIAVLREIGVETGGSNVQFAVNPEDGRLVVIEMNPRVSRSSALASKATGFPIAKVAAKLAVGYTLDEIANDITGGATPASFEPTIDYVVTKIPRFAFEKFPGADPMLTTSMKSVGEAMAIGRTFQESLQKALRSLETGLTGLDEIAIEGLGPGRRQERRSAPRSARRRRTGCSKSRRRCGSASPTSEIHAPARSIRGSSREIRDIVETEAEIKAEGPAEDRRRVPPPQGDGLFRRAARQADRPQPKPTCAAARRALGVRPVFKRIDTCAAEFASPTAYMYSTYETPFAGARRRRGAAVATRRRSSSSAAGRTASARASSSTIAAATPASRCSDAGYETIMINCNPETVSTDYDTSDRLYFEPLTAEDVLEIIDTERSNGTLHGVIVQFGGQTPLKLAEALEKANVPILGTSPDAIDLAEDRDRFKQLLDKLKLSQPENGIATRSSRRALIADELGYPLVIRPSYVLGGRAMEIVRDDAQLDRLPARHAGCAARPRPARSTRPAVGARQEPAADRPLSLRRDRGRCRLPRRRQGHVHRRHHGAHRGSRHPLRRFAPARCRRIRSTQETIAELERQTRALALALNVGGLMNVQYAIKDGDIYVLEVNPRASRTVPFVAKVIGLPIAKIAARDHGRRKRWPSSTCKTAEVSTISRQGSRVPVRALPRRRHRARPGDEIDRRGHGHRPSFDIAFAKSQLGGGASLPRAGTVFVSVRDGDKPRILETRQLLAELGFKVIATGGTQRFLSRARRRGREDQQGAGRPPAHRRCDQERRGPAGFQHHRGGQGAGRQPLAAAGSPLA